MQKDVALIQILISFLFVSDPDDSVPHTPKVLNPISDKALASALTIHPLPFYE